jgi:hypothetical protein
VEGTLLSETGGTATRVAAVLAAYNRRDLTLACLRSLRAQRLPTVTLDVFVLDDASSDGTGERIAEQFPEVTLLHGNGRLYWNGGMRRAFGAAIAGDYDYYLWMSDDTQLEDNALAVLLDTERRRRGRGEEAVIVAGSTRHPETGELTYSGVVQPYRWRPFKTVLVEPGDAPRPCDTMNGNATPICCTKHGSRLPTRATTGREMSDRCRLGEEPMGRELRRLWSIKELSPGPWAVYTRRWSGRLWPVHWLSPYVHHGVRLSLERTPLGRPRRAMS